MENKPPEVMGTEYVFAYLSQGLSGSVSEGLKQGCGGALGELSLPAHLSPGKGYVSEKKAI